jgi:nucleoside-diphosphate-sugar epimerase
MVGPTVMVTGGCGFIGSRLVAALRTSGHSVRVLDIPRADFAHVEAMGAKVFRGSVADAESVRKALGNSETVFHLASPDPTIRDERFWRKMVVGGVRVLMEEVEDSRVEHVLGASTVGVVAQADGVRTEDDAIKPGTLFEKVLADAERYLSVGAGDAGVGASVLRLPNVYGRGDGGIVDRLVPEVRDSAGGEVVLPDHGYVSCVHVDDVVAAMEALGRGPAPGVDGDDCDAPLRVLNCVDGRPMTPAELVAVVAGGVGVPVPGLRRPGRLRDPRGQWRARDRVARQVERNRYSAARLVAAVPAWPRWPSLEVGLPGEISRGKG